MHLPREIEERIERVALGEATADDVGSLRDFCGAAAGNSHAVQQALQEAMATWDALERYHALTDESLFTAPVGRFGERVADLSLRVESLDVAFPERELLQDMLDVLADMAATRGQVGSAAAQPVFRPRRWRGRPVLALAAVLALVAAATTFAVRLLSGPAPVVAERVWMQSMPAGTFGRREGIMQALFEGDNRVQTWALDGLNDAEIVDCPDGREIRRLVALSFINDSTHQAGLVRLWDPTHDLRDPEAIVATLPLVPEELAARTSGASWSSNGIFALPDGPTTDFIATGADVNGTLNSISVLSVRSGPELVRDGLYLHEGQISPWDVVSTPQGQFVWFTGVHNVDPVVLPGDAPYLRVASLVSVDAIRGGAYGDRTAAVSADSAPQGFGGEAVYAFCAPIPGYTHTNPMPHATTIAPDGYAESVEVEVENRWYHIRPDGTRTTAVLADSAAQEHGLAVAELTGGFMGGYDHQMVDIPVCESEDEFMHWLVGWYLNTYAPAVDEWRKRVEPLIASGQTSDAFARQFQRDLVTVEKTRESLEELR